MERQYYNYAVVTWLVGFWIIITGIIFVNLDNVPYFLLVLVSKVGGVIALAGSAWILSYGFSRKIRILNMHYLLSGVIAGIASSICVLYAVSLAVAVTK